MFKQLGTFAILAVCLFALVCASVCPPVAADIWTSGKVVYTTNALGDKDIAVMGPNGEHVEVLTTSTDDEYAPTWSPDGSEILYVRDRNIWLMDADGDNQRRILTNSSFPSWAPDGDRFVCNDSSGNVNIWTLNAARDGFGDLETRVSSNIAGHPAWSPDGKYIAYVAGSASFPTGASLYVYDVAAERSTKIVSGSPGRYMSSPTWGPQSYRIVFAWENAGFGDGNRGIFSVRRDGGGLAIMNWWGGYYLNYPTVAPYGGEFIVTRVDPTDSRNRRLYKVTRRTNNWQVMGHSDATYNANTDWWHPSSFSVEPGASKLTTTWGSLKKKAK